MKLNNRQQPVNLFLHEFILKIVDEVYILYIKERRKTHKPRKYMC